MRSYPVKENRIGSVVSEILYYKQTNRQTDIVLLCIIDKNKEDLVLGKHIYEF